MVEFKSIFEGWMNAAAAATPSTNTSYLQDTSGIEWTQMIEKGLMGACFAKSNDFKLSSRYFRR